MSVLRYPTRSLVGDYLRAGAGLALTGGPMLAIPLGSPGSYVLGPLALLFVAFGVRTLRRQFSRVEFSPEEISLFAPGRVTLAWNELTAVRLSFYSAVADRRGGWMQLTLKGPRGRGSALRIDSHLDGFEGVARHAFAAATKLRLPLSPASVANFEALGCRGPEPSET